MKNESLTGADVKNNTLASNKIMNGTLTGKTSRTASSWVRKDMTRERVRQIEVESLRRLASLREIDAVATS